MILKARHNFFIYPFFKWYAGWIIHRHFGHVRINGIFEDQKLPVLLLANHVSWWDGFWAMYLNVNVFRRKFHFMMLEEQLRKFRFFNYTGGFSVQKNAKSLVDSLNYTSGLLGDNQNMVLVFPQGKIESMHQQHFKFEKGIERILNGKAGKVQIVMMVNLVDYFSSRKPGTDMYIQTLQPVSYTQGEIEEEFNKFYMLCLENQKLINR
jgi:1-acyl-sn-glycerol-3-phosphate acyltransferase